MEGHVGGSVSGRGGVGKGGGLGGTEVVEGNDC